MEDVQDLAALSVPPEDSVKSEARRLLLAIVIVLMVTLATLGSITVLGVYVFSRFTTADRYINIVDGTIAVPAGHYHYYWNTVPAGGTSLSITGSFIASGGTTNDIEVLVMNQTSYESWINGYQVSTYFDSGRVSVGNIYAPLPSSGTYYLIYDNSFSTTYGKSVQTNAMLHFRV